MSTLYENTKFQQFLKSKINPNDSCHKETVNEVRMMIVQSFIDIKEGKAQEGTTFRYVVQYLDQNTELSTLPASAFMDWLLTDELAQQLKEKKVTAKQYAEKLIEKKNIRDTITSLLE